MKRWVKWLIGSVAGVLLIAVLGVLWLLNTQSGARTAVALAHSALKDSLRIGAVEGTLAGPLTVRDVRYSDAASGLAVTVDQATLDLALRALFATRIHVVSAEIAGLDVALGESHEDEPATTDEPFTLEAPVDIVIERFALRKARVHRDGEELVGVRSAAFAGRWIGRTIQVEQLDVNANQGEIRFAGKVSQADAYQGEGNGRFRWRAGEQEFAGTLQANANERDALVIVGLTEPLRADLDVTLTQRPTLPWRFKLDVPAFDPRERLLPDASLERLAAQLQGEGTMAQGVVRGVIDLNGEPLEFKALRFEHADDLLQLGAEILAGGGTLQADGTVQLAAQPVSAKFDAQWGELTIPERWVGQVLRTRGQLAFEGSADAYRANGEILLGPPDQVANIHLALAGSPQRIDFEQFDIVQPKGRLAAKGTVELEPRLAWTFDASANRFNPGNFAVDWPGDLSFTLATQGDIDDVGPQAHVQLQDLRGQLRGRTLAGRADIQLARNKLFSGIADLRSGASRVRLDARPGDAIDATARIEVASLDDWLPNAGGSVQGRFDVTGVWPELRIDGRARARNLQLDESSVQSLQLALEVNNPLEPNGAVDVTLTGVAAAGMELERVKLRADGNQAEHRLQLDARGQPISTRVALTGGLQEQTWRGEVQRLDLDVEKVANLALQNPVEVLYSPAESRVSDACFVDGDIRLCLAGQMQEAGTLQANYSLQNIPLALASAFAGEDSAIAIAGTLEGEGRIERNEDGQFNGDANLRSARAEINQRAVEGDAPVRLLVFEDLQFAANLAGESATAQLGARLNESGSLRGEVTAAGIDAPNPQIDGAVSLSLPSIAILEAFAPQVANVQGRIDLRADVGGTVEEPQIAGELRAAGLALDLPELGLQLKNGSVALTPRTDNRFDLEGGIDSGKGRLTLEGILDPSGTSNVTIDGKQFLAADMPGAYVIIEPKLAIEHAAERLTVRGDVAIPQANINLQELPSGGGGGGAKASSDVVIVDAETAAEEASELPIYADVNVTLGDRVELVGFGLAATASGRLTVIERPGSPTRGSGVMRVAGTYRAYGQDLTIQKGELVYANTPLENPSLNIVAVREIEEVIAGLRVTGDATNPILTVFSNPEMGQANALSYLVAGKPLDQIRQGGGEGDALQTAARSLGTAAGGLLTKNLGKRLGIDEVGIQDSDMIGGSAFTIGQYLSPRLYLSYGIGLFEPGEVVTLRYKLSEALALQAQSGTDESRAGVEYRKER
jgi:translocation and assembly module TamB